MTKPFWEFRNEDGSAPELLLYGPISDFSWWGDEVTPKQFADDLKALGNISNLTVRINSGGGDVFAATAIYTQLKTHPANVTVQIDGLAASAATIIAMAGDTIQAPANAMMMIHDPMLVLFGYYNAEDMAKMAGTLDKVKNSIINAYVSKTKRSASDLAEMMTKETWMTADEAKAEGFIDEVMFEEIDDASVTNDGRYMVVNSVAHDMSRFQTRPNLKPAAKAAPAQKPGATRPAAQLSVPQPKNSSKEGENALEIKNIDELKQKYPELCNQLEAAAATKATADASAAERNRLKAIDEIAPTVPQALVNKAKYEEPMTAEALAFAALKADAAAGKTFSAEREAELAAASAVPGATPPAKPQEQEAAVVDSIAAGINQKRPKEGQR